MKSRDLIGKHIQLQDSHPHAGETGIIDRIETTAFGSTGIIIKLDNCPDLVEECFVFKSDDIKFV